jgi:glycosyltransferase involved in cell wall biosynthesis
MRILVANDGFNDAGGVQAYLDAVIAALEARGHSIAIAYCTDSLRDEARGVSRRLQRFQLAGARTREALGALREWAPDVCYSHNMANLAIDRDLQGIAPVVKFMHGYFGTCVGGQKMHAFPRPVVCDRVFGLSCAALYLPRRCGRLRPAVLLEQWRWAVAQRSLFDTYAAIVVASDHMRREYVRNGCDAARVHVNALFPTHALDAGVSPGPADPHVVFLGRMTKLKGGDLLIRGVRHAVARLHSPIRLTMAGDGPQRQEWQALARRLGVPCTFTGWVNGAERRTLMRSATVVALPSLWPEPFGLVGLEAGAVGVPAIAVDAGGVREWLREGVNGVAVRQPASGRSFGDALASLLGDRDTLAALRGGAYRVAQEMTLAAHVDRLEPILGSAGASPSRVVTSNGHGAGVPR